MLRDRVPVMSPAVLRADDFNVVLTRLQVDAAPAADRQALVAALQEAVGVDVVERLTVQLQCQALAGVVLDGNLDRRDARVEITAR